MAAKKEIPSGNIFEVEVAQLHQPVGVGGVIASNKTINSINSPGIKMSWTPLGLLIERKGKKAVIPAANVAVALLKM